MEFYTHLCLSKRTAFILHVLLVFCSPRLSARELYRIAPCQFQAATQQDMCLSSAD